MEKAVMALPAEVLDKGLEGADGFLAWKAEEKALLDQLFEAEYERFARKVIALDDDPTGTQTVHDVPVITDWEEESIAEAFRDPGKLVFILTNSRSFSAARTAVEHRRIAERVLAASARAGKDFLVISRGDSTLRGHYPLETDTLRRTFEETGAKHFDGELLWPFFKEGGRFTINGVHYVREGAVLTPAAQTEFARDATFGYGNSFLPAYMEEKSGGIIRQESVFVIRLADLRGTDENCRELPERLDSLEKRILGCGAAYLPMAVDAIEEADVKAAALVLMRLMAKGKNYLIRSAAAAVKVFGNVSDKALLSREELLDGCADVQRGGLVIVGSHVKRTSDQLEALRASGLALEWIEFDAGQYAAESGLERETARCTALAEEAIAEGRTAVVYTSRTLIKPQGASPEELLAISVAISDALTGVVGRLSVKPSFLIAKGGITSSDVATKALKIRKAMVLGQAAPGIPVWKTGPESTFPGISYIIFPGNVGTDNTLREVVERLTRS